MKAFILQRTSTTMNDIFQRLGLHQSLQDVAFITGLVLIRIELPLHFISKAFDLVSIANENPNTRPALTPCQYYFKQNFMNKTSLKLIKI